MNQLSIFDLVEDRFCFDDDINEIVKRLDALTAKHNLEIGRKEFDIWSHVPKHGYRFSCRIDYEIVPSQCFLDELVALVDWAKERNVKLSPLDGWGSLHLSTMFLDKRKKIK